MKCLSTQDKMSKLKCNYHTHTTFSDGKNSPEDMVKKAIEIGFTRLGFSEHSSCFIYEHERLDYDAYFNEIFRLKEKYKDIIEIYAGIEQDTYASKYDERSEYIIGSLHHLGKEYDYMEIDRSKENTLECVKRYFDFDFYKYAKAYYEKESEVCILTHPDVIGHFDLLTKFNEGYNQFSEDNPKYLKYAFESMDCLLEYNVPFEMNTGAIGRGYRTTPYMNPILMKHLCEKGGEIVISSDCHNLNYLDVEFDTCIEIAKQVGFKYTNILTKNGWTSIPLDTL